MPYSNPQHNLAVVAGARARLAALDDRRRVHVHEGQSAERIVRAHEHDEKQIEHERLYHSQFGATQSLTLHQLRNGHRRGRVEPIVNGSAKWTGAVRGGGCKATHSLSFFMGVSVQLFITVFRK